MDAMGQKKTITDLIRNGVMQFLLGSLLPDKCPHEKISEVAALFNVGWQTISRIWKELKYQRAFSEVLDVPLLYFNECKHIMQKPLQIVPAIKQKWPSILSKNINIQQDNARTHISYIDAEFQEVATSDGFNIKLIQQPAKSLDCNANDLGFFCAIQSLQHRKNCRSANQLIAAVLSSFNELHSMTLNKVFLSLQCVLIEILKAKGTNNFKLPHMKKDSLIRQGSLPTNLEVPQYLVRETIGYLIGEECTEGIEGLIEAMGISLPQEGVGVPDLNA